MVYNLSLGGKDENRLSQIVTTELQTIWAGGVGLRGGRWGARVSLRSSPLLFELSAPPAFPSAADC